MHPVPGRLWGWLWVRGQGDFPGVLSGSRDQALASDSDEALEAGVAVAVRLLGVVGEGLGIRHDGLGRRRPAIADDAPYLPILQPLGDAGGRIARIEPDCPPPPGASARPRRADARIQRPPRPCRRVRKGCSALRRPRYHRRRLCRGRGLRRLHARPARRHARRSESRDAVRQAAEDRADREHTVRRSTGQSECDSGDVPPDRAAGNPLGRRVPRCPARLVARGRRLHLWRNARENGVCPGKDGWPRRAWAARTRNAGPWIIRKPVGAGPLADGVALLPPDAVSIESGAPLRFQPFCDC